MNEITKYSEIISVNEDCFLDYDENIFRNPKTKYCVCGCIHHQGTFVAQVEADLPNGLPIVVMWDIDGYHLSIGEWDDNYPPPAISEKEINHRIREALTWKK